MLPLGVRDHVPPPIPYPLPFHMRVHGPLPVLHDPGFVHVVASDDLVLLLLCVDADECLHLHAAAE